MRRLQRLLFLLLLVGSGCQTFPAYEAGGEVTFLQQEQDLYSLYASKDVSQLKRLLVADIWLLDQRFSLTLQEITTLEKRVNLMRAMINILEEQ